MNTSDLPLSKDTLLLMGVEQEWDSISPSSQQALRRRWYRMQVEAKGFKVQWNTKEEIAEIAEIEAAAAAQRRSKP